MASVWFRFEQLDKKTGFLRMQGDFIGLDALHLKSDLLKTVDLFSGATLVMDLNTIGYIDSAGISVLIALAQASIKKKITFGIINANESVKKVLLITKLDKILTFFN